MEYELLITKDRCYPRKLLEKLKDAAPTLFTSQYSKNQATDVNKDLFALGIPAYNRKTVGPYLESLGARTDTPPPFPVKDEDPPLTISEPKPVHVKSTVVCKPKVRQMSLL